MKVAVFGQSDPDLANTLRIAAETECQTVLDATSLEICDEWQTRRWFNDFQPDLVLIATRGLPERSVKDLLTHSQGFINVINSAVDTVKCLRVFGFFGSNSLFLIRRLCELYREEKSVDFRIGLARDRLDLANAAVLIIRDVLAKEANTESAQSAQQDGEVCHQAVSERPSSQQHGPQTAPLLEVPVEAAQGQAPGDVCAQRPAPAGAAAPGAVHDHTGAV